MNLIIAKSQRMELADASDEFKNYLVYRYQKIRTIGEGTYGVVYEAKDATTGNTVVFKKSSRILHMNAFSSRASWNFALEGPFKTLPLLRTVSLMDQQRSTWFLNMPSAT
eukprot:TRINITY_DN89880_c0_g1_i1.p4 TRINITY_DN89880_c0_g1~~TRINITY_DN89880_c0_g1_i1.p4  ORF type:complete len:127 (-),score=8.28 TRINITY_DN89880_c0_g1_i1:759-1088(-)